MAVLLTVRRGGSGPGRWLVAAVAVEVAWSVAMAAWLGTGLPPRAVLATVEALRPFAWVVFLLSMLWAPERRVAVGAGIALAAALAVLQPLAALRGVEAGPTFAIALCAAVLSLACVEQVYRNTPDHRRWAIKFACLALAALSAFDIVLYADAAFQRRIQFGWWASRGYAHAMVVPLIAVSAARMRDWRLDIKVSRDVVFHSAALLGSGAFVVATAALVYGLRVLGGAWGTVAQSLVVFAASTALLALATSGSLRARLRVLLAKHFFTYRYDYRTEWLRLTDQLARPDGPDGSLADRALRGMADLVECTAGSLWLRTDDGRWASPVRMDVPEREPLAADDPLPTFLAARGWIVDVPEWRAQPERYGALALPDWLASDPDAWVVVPLALQDQTIGFVQLQRPRTPTRLDWEVRDVLNTAGRQVAGYLAVRQAVEKLVQARQFDSFNRMSAFVVHDLKNLVAQLSLLLKNADRHRDNPEFQQDMLETVGNVLGRMQGLLMQLRVGTRPIEPPGPLPLGPVLRAALAAKRGLRPEPTLEIADDVEHATIVAHRDRIERVVGHLVQNAAEACAGGGTIRVVARRDGERVAVDVADTGCGMSRAFVRDRLFRPFASTKEHGMGIGAFESREYLREIGGNLSVDSAEGRGTTFTIHLTAPPPPGAPPPPAARAQAVASPQET